MKFLIGMLTGLILGSLGVAIAFDYSPRYAPPPVFVTPPIFIPPYPPAYQSLPPLPHAHFGEIDPC